MGNRYWLIRFDASRVPAELLSEILQRAAPDNAIYADSLPEKRGRPWDEVFQHFVQLQCVTLLIQCGITDPDYLDEHAAFYAKQHKDVSRRCIRVHGFVLDAPPNGEDPQAVLEFLDSAVRTERAYLGFATLRPLRHARVGASILTAPDTVTVRDFFPVHIGGNNFRVDGTPFLQQDSAVGACAQASIWMALRAMRRRFGNAAYSVAELTVAATRFLALDRVFPGRDGLEISQMLEAIRFTGHDPLHLDLSRSRKKKIAEARSHAEEVISRAGPYIESGLPVILALEFEHAGHSLVAVGRTVDSLTLADTRSQKRPNFRYAEDWLVELIVHNDNTGPYMRMTERSAAGEAEEYTLDDVVSLIVPLPDAVFTTAAEARELGAKTLELMSMYFWGSFVGEDAGPPPDFDNLPAVPQHEEVTARIYLCKRHDFRRWVKDVSDLDPGTRQIYRTMELPALIWVVELHLADHYNPKDRASSRCGEILLDAAADALHGDGLIAARITGHLFPQTIVADYQMLFVDSPKPGFKLVQAGQLGQALWEPWRSDDH
ncbi:MAG: hypothetical protein E6Q67_01825 [Roseateles sp.]|nr:MAG: hypothetical protein E6Q67_01825 [Roseateles sp.]